jgi:hypothetical protein
LNLASATARNAALPSVGPLTAGIVPASIVTLFEGVLFDMASFKLKTAAVALLLTSVLAGSLIVSAQGPGPAPGTSRSSNSDRFTALEAKLDRLIRALEKVGAATNPAPLGDTLYPPPGETQVQPENYQGEVQYAPFHGQASRNQTTPGYGADAPKDNKGTMPGNIAPGDWVAGPALSPPAKGLEQRVADLERRFAALERAVRALQSSHQPRGPANAEQPRKK